MEYVAYDKAKNVIHSERVRARNHQPTKTLDEFAAEHPSNDVALVVNSRERRVIEAAQ